MKFIDWLFSSYPNPHVDGQWGLLHIITLVLCVALVVVGSILLKNKSQKTKRIFLGVLVGILLFFEITRRVIGLVRLTEFDLNRVLTILLPRPGCAISCWLAIIAVIVNKKVVYNIASIVGIISAVIFFAYPGVGFNNQYILFENLYSIVTHSLFFVADILFITLKFTDFKYKKCWKELIGVAIIAVYVVLEMFVFKIEHDPFYFMPNNDIQEIVGFSYGVFLVLYICFVVLYFNVYYLISERKNIFKKRSKK